VFLRPATIAYEMIIIISSMSRIPAMLGQIYVISHIGITCGFEIIAPNALSNGAMIMFPKKYSVKTVNVFIPSARLAKYISSVVAISHLPA
jgi:hypothetical protein